MTELDLFDDPGGGQVEWEALQGKLLLIWPISIEEKVKTKDYGEKDATRADLVVLDGPDGPERIPDILVFPLVLQGQLRRNVGKGRPMMGRLGQGEATGKQKPPWKLLEASDEDKTIARRFLFQNTSGTADKYDDVPF